MAPKCGIIKQSGNGSQQLSRAGSAASFGKQLAFGLPHEILQPNGILLNLRAGAVGRHKNGNGGRLSRGDDGF